MLKMATTQSSLPDFLDIRPPLSNAVFFGWFVESVDHLLLYGGVGQYGFIFRSLAMQLYR